jgi:hypothetical protein
VDLANLGSESETCVGSCVRLVGVSISFEKIFYQLPFTPPSLVRRIGPSVGIEHDPKYKTSGVLMLSDVDLEAVGPNCARLHAYVMEHSRDKLVFPANVDQDYFQGGGALMLNIAFSDMYNLITLASKDVTFLRLWTL